jgi:hypothetical protein
MNFPDKVTCYSDSILATFPKILSIVQKKSLSAFLLYQRIQPMNIADFMEALDCLYAMRKIEIKEGMVSYVA